MAGHSTGHVHIELVDQISECWNEKKLGIFVDLSKPFDRVDRETLS